MKVKSRTGQRSGCPISIALEIFGDSWSLLIIRDLMFKGLRTFNEFAASDEGIATNILADRLAKLETAGILVKRPDSADARRIHYRLTEKGIDLAPALVEIVLWTTRYEKTDAPPSMVRAMRSRREQFLADVRARWAAAT
jgi:DNA-binding HxlR family transcriptional regulator